VRCRPRSRQDLPTVKNEHGAENAFDSIGQNAGRGTRPDRPARQNPSHANGLRFDRRAPFISPS
ncbi:hypothetical protein, partial [Pseudomonas sp. FW305-BF8]|uniref:hypothetical protein n=1 Tax=Pseudomonas sp. FW305-BF8 TaxID=2070602 RepID=UPI001C44ABE5